MENKAVLVVPYYKSERNLDLATKDSMISFELRAVHTEEVANRLENKRPCPMDRLMRIMDVDVYWSDPPKTSAELGWYEGEPRLDVRVDLMQARNISPSMLNLVPRMIEIAAEIRDYYESNPVLADGRTLTKTRLDRMIRMCEMEAASEAEQAVKRARDPGFTKKEAKDILEHFKAKLGRNHERDVVIMAGRDGTHRLGSEYKLYFKRIITNSGARVDLQQTRWGGRTSVADQLRVLQEEISATKTRELWANLSTPITHL
jgi:hypothetical protein